MSSVRVLAGTRKGAFILTADGKRKNWEVSGPFFAGWEIYHMKGSPADPNRIYASQSSGWFGQLMQRSDDGGKTWAAGGQQVCLRRRARHAPVVRRHAAPVGVQARVAPGAVAHRSRHGVRGRGRRGAVQVHRWRAELGGAVAACASTTRGPHWQPGAGGMCLHTILLDPTNPGADVHRHLRGGRLPHRRWRQDVEAHQQGAGFELHARTRPPRSATACITSPCTPRGPTCSSCRSTGT